MAAAKAIVTKYDRKKLARHGEHIEITKHYARSLLREMGLVKRKGTKDVRNLPNDFDENKTEIINKVDKVKNDHSVPESLILNCYQTGCQLVPGGDWIMKTKDTNQVPLAGIDETDNVSFVSD